VGRVGRFELFNPGAGQQPVHFLPDIQIIEQLHDFARCGSLDPAKVRDPVQIEVGETK
jgi:hypothetical protein